MLVKPPRATLHVRRRNVALAGLAGVALLLHASLLGVLPWPAAGRLSQPAALAAMHVRVLEPEPERVATAAPVERVAPQPKPSVKATAPRRPPSRPKPEIAASTVVQPEPQPDPVPEPTAVLAGSTDPALPAAMSSAMSSDLAPRPAEQPLPHQTSATSDQELPVYRTLIPPALTLSYQLRRGALQGSGELRWRPQGERYEAHLEGRLAGLTVLTQTSQGGFDEAGVAPMRFTDLRLRGATQAANFQRQAGKITFSGPSIEYPLLIGSQDRLSWMIQLAAVVSAEPQRLQDGGKVVIHVVGARADSSLWVFRFAGHEPVATGAGAVQAAKFVRDAQGVHDTRVEVWLDPRRHHLPARATWRSGPDDQGLELLLQDSVGTP